MVHVHKRVDSLQFGILSPKKIKKMAAAKIVTPELYDKEGYPVDGGLMDIRLGVIDPGLTCKTCGHRLKDCPGHFGYIELARPVVHILFIDRVMTLLQSTCNSCGRVKLADADIKKFKRKLTKIERERGTTEVNREIKKMIVKLRGVGKCPHCKAKQEAISLEKPYRFIEKEKRLSTIEIRARLEKITDSDLELYGIDPQSLRPEWMVLTILPIPSVSMRPSITLQSGERSEDDLTHKLGDIVRINQRLFENINAGAPEVIIEDLWDLLQYHVTTYFKNDVAQLPPARHRSGEPLKTLSDRIKSKQGRIRQNLAGKRTNFSARTVVSPDASIKINEIGIPDVMAKKLTVPERCTAWNAEYLKTIINNGPTKYPGANYVMRPDGKKKRITDETKEELIEELEPGYVVERHLIDGDIALFNRQPSLHRMSMMCHRVVVLPGKTFRMNPAVCHPYNADFDGDEMNLHIPQTEEARAEAQILMEIQTQLISPAYGLSVMGCTQDAVTGNFLLTQDDVSMTRSEAVSLLFSVNVTDFDRLPKKDTVTGKEIFSSLLPESLNFVGESSSGEEIVIKDGVLTSGILDGKQLTPGSGFLLRTIHKEYGADETARILTNIFALGIKYLLKRGFTTGINDVHIPESLKGDITKVIDESYTEVNALIDTFNNGKLVSLPGRTMRETLEIEIVGALNKARNQATNLLADVVEQDNSVLVMAKSGARGKMMNLSQMSAVVGQQSLGGGRVSEGYRGRTLSHFKRGDLGAESQGFIKNAFRDGLKPAEFYFGAMTARNSLMDVGLRTPKSGYLYRRLSNAMQDLKVEYDGTVRDSGQMIVQFAYGEDGMDVARTENGTIDVKKIIAKVLNK